MLSSHSVVTFFVRKPREMSASLAENLPQKSRHFPAAFWELDALAGAAHIPVACSPNHGRHMNTFVLMK
jgi:hypothetical protein